MKENNKKSIFPETDAISLQFNSHKGLNIHNPNSVPNDWSAGCVVENGKSPASTILEEAGHVFSQGSLYEQLMKSAKPSIGSLGGDVGGAEPPTLTVTATMMAEELEALPKSVRELMDVEEIIGELRSQGDEVAVEIDNPRFEKFTWNLMGGMSKNYTPKYFGGVDPASLPGNADLVTAFGMAVASSVEYKKPEEIIEQYGDILSEKDKQNINQIK